MVEVKNTEDIDVEDISIMLACSEFSASPLNASKGVLRRVPRSELSRPRLTVKMQSMLEM